MPSASHLYFDLIYKSGSEKIIRQSVKDCSVRPYLYANVPVSATVAEIPVAGSASRMAAASSKRVFVFASTPSARSATKREIVSFSVPPQLLLVPPETHAFCAYGAGGSMIICFAVAELRPWRN